ncbi:MAG: 3-keto-disaccharide hydrolase [Candidatus Acidiferrales bacterium]
MFGFRGRAIAFCASLLFMTLLLIFAGSEIVPQFSFAQEAPQAGQPATPSPGQSGAGPEQGGRAGRGRGGRGPRYVAPEPMNFDDHAGWQSLFDGVTLKGWDGPTDVWTVANGAIVATSTAANPAGSTYMIWTGGEPANFEFKTEMKLDGEGANSGIQFRATRLDAIAGRKYSQWDTRGYQADADYKNSNTGALIECCAGSSRGVPIRTDRAYRGQMVSAALGTDLKPTLLATFGDPDALSGYIKIGDWNQVYLIARGDTMFYSINGHLMSVFVDDHPTRARKKGVLALQLEGRGDIKASFRNIWLKDLP